MPIQKPVYLDYNATTPVDPRVFDAMRPFFSHTFGNAASASHSFGYAAKEAVEHAREQAAGLLNAHAPEIVWTGRPLQRAA
jgi:cysteine desulfurase